MGYLNLYSVVETAVAGMVTIFKCPAWLCIILTAEDES